MTPAWVQRQEALWCDCVVSPAVFTPMVERLHDFVRPYPYALETEAGTRQGSRSLAGRLAHFPRQQAEDIAPLGDGERQVLQDCSGTALWDHRPWVQGWVRAGGERWGEPEGSMAGDPSRGPQRGTHAGGGETAMGWAPRPGRQRSGRRLQGVRVSLGAGLTRLPLVPPGRLGTSPDAARSMPRTRGGAVAHAPGPGCGSGAPWGARRSRTAGGRVTRPGGTPPGCATRGASGGHGMGWRGPAPRPSAPWRPHGLPSRGAGGRRRRGSR
jgi:hypothetical protein